MKRILLAMPAYGTQTPRATRAYWRASRGVVRIGDEPHELHVQEHQVTFSLLACAFNDAWCNLLNAAVDGHPYDYFAMLHGDVQPQPGWLDVMIEELESQGLDVLSAVVPIKSNQGLTSTAIEHDSGDTWRFKCRLTMHEVCRLPETFTSEDVGGKLLLNTGCWVYRFNLEQAEQLFFTINDRIVKRPDGHYVQHVEPEDWFFSRLCNEMELKTAATRKVPLTHGDERYTNDEPWGTQQFDRAHVSASVIPESPFRFPRDVEGWLSYREGKALYDLARGKRVLEIGSYCGRSTVCIAQSAESVHCIDPFDGRSTPSPGSTYEKFRDALVRYEWDHKVDATIGTRSDYAGEPDSFDLIFIDGAHDHANVSADIEFAEAMLKPDGMLAFHDYRLTPGEYDGGWDPGVTKAVNELIERGGKLLSRHGSVAVVKPKIKELAHA